MATLKESIKNNRKHLRQMFKNMGYDSFMDGFSESIETNKGTFYLSSISYGSHEISNKKEELIFKFKGDRDTISEMVNKISDFFDKNDVLIDSKK